MINEWKILVVTCIFKDNEYIKRVNGKDIKGLGDKYNFLI